MSLVLVTDSTRHNKLFITAATVYKKDSQILMTCLITINFITNYLKDKSGFITLYIFLIVNKSHEKVKTNNVIVSQRQRRFFFLQ